MLAATVFHFGTVAIAVTPWKYLELYGAFRGSSNRNTRPDYPARTDPEVMTALGRRYARVYTDMPPEGEDGSETEPETAS